MKKLLMVIIISVMLGCGQSYNNPKVDINSTSYSLTATSCYITGTEGGPTVYKLEIDFIEEGSTETTETITFIVLDPDNNPQNLSAIGEHSATSSTYGQIEYKLEGIDRQYTYKIQEDNIFSIVWDEITQAPGTEGQVIGKGYIHIKAEIGNKYLSAWSGDGNLTEDVYPAQKIYFECPENNQ
jgi:hypothetical protein